MASLDVFGVLFMFVGFFITVILVSIRLKCRLSVEGFDLLGIFLAIRGLCDGIEGSIRISIWLLKGGCCHSETVRQKPSFLKDSS